MKSHIPVNHAAVIGQLAFEQAARDLNGRRVARRDRRRRAGR